MEFLITRTSVYGKRPCKEASLKKFIYVDRRTVRTLEEARLPKHKHWADQFFASGSNHREEHGMVMRDLELEGKWVISLDTLEELVQLRNKYGRLIFGEGSDYKGIDQYIEIYDDYRE